MGEKWQRPALMFALVAILGLCLGLALWRAFRDHPTDRVRMLVNETRSNISRTENISITESGRLRLVKRSDCDEGIVWLDDPAYDIDPRSYNPDDVWEVRGEAIILHVDKLVAMPHCISTMSVAVGGSIIEFKAPIENEVTLNNTGWDGCSPVEANVTVFDEQGRTYRRENDIEPEENCEKASFSRAPAETGPDGANIGGPVAGGVVLVVVVVVLVFGVARTSIGRGTRKATVSTEEENDEDIPMRPINAKSSNRVSKRKSQIRERVDERMKTELVDVEGCRYSFVQDYGTAYGINQEELSEEDYDVESAVKRDNFHTTLRDNSSVA